MTLSVEASKRQSTFDLSGRAAVVTGASRGIGQAVAVALARQGADVLAVARSAEGLSQTAALAVGAPGSIVIHPADLRRPDEIEDTVAHAQRALGGIDVLVNNAAAEHVSHFEDTSLATYQQVLELNLQSCWLLCRAASKALHGGDGGSVVNVASMLGLVGSRQESAYVAAKHALVGLTRSLALEWARTGVRVNALAPGYVETTMTKEGLADDGYAHWVRRNTPLGRWAQPEEMTGPAMFLASQASRYMTGQVLVVDGGWTVQ